MPKEKGKEKSLSYTPTIYSESGPCERGGAEVSFSVGTVPLYYMYCDSVDSMVFTDENGHVIKMSIVAFRRRKLPVFVNEEEVEKPKCVLLRHQFEREKIMQQQIYASMLPWTHACPQLYEATLYDPGTCRPFLGSFIGQTPLAQRMLDYLKTNLSADSIGVLRMERIPPTYVQLREYIRGGPRGRPQPLQVRIQYVYAAALTVLIFLTTEIFNPDLHPGNIMVYDGNPADVEYPVYLLDWGRGARDRMYASHSSSGIRSGDPVVDAHRDRRRSRYFSTLYPSLRNYGVLDVDAIFRVLQHCAVMDYEINPVGLQCRHMLQAVFPSMKYNGMYEVEPTDDLFNAEWFGRDDPVCTENLQQILGLIQRFGQNQARLGPAAMEARSLSSRNMAEFGRDLALLQSIAEEPHVEGPAALEASDDLDALDAPALKDQEDSGASRHGGGKFKWAPRKWYTVPPTIIVGYNKHTKTMFIKCPERGATRKRKKMSRKHRKKASRRRI